ncbi:MAG: glycosyl hydrolase, partial [Cystobacter sp.]
SYLTNDYKMPQPRDPKYRASNVKAPLPSNDWWQSLFIKPLGDMIVTQPLKSKFYNQGLGILNPGAGTINANGSSVNAGGNPDLFLSASNIDTSRMANRVTGYGDWSVDTVLSDDTTDKFKVTFVKGSPYIYTQFSDPASVEIYSARITQILNDTGGAILTTDGASVTTDRIAVKVVNPDNKGVLQTRYYGLFAPAGTVFRKVGPKLKIQLGSGEGYLSVAALPSAADLGFFHQHAYAFVTDTRVNYLFDEASAQLTTTFTLATQLKRTGFSDQTLTALFPHQWKSSISPLTALSYPSVRGTLKVREGNTFVTTNRFHGIVPQFTEPGNAEYSRQLLSQYLTTLERETANNQLGADAYWQGKSLHPLAMGALAADEIGDTVSRDLFLSRIRTILTEWYTYTPGEKDYFFYYNPDWGTTYYRVSEFGANTGITDHHFTYGYYVFASAVLATYDPNFRTQFGPMVEHLIRDYANPSRTDALYPFFRNFDPYEGHSWAGGYADNDDGNNQEAAGEALFGWVGEYLWGVATGNKSLRDAGIFGFTTELKAVEQYWFNYDGDNWLPQWTHKTVGQVYGASNFFGTFFNGAPVYVYGIHWLPTSEYLTSYGFEQSKVAALYNGYVTDSGGPDERDWKHVLWPILSLSDPQAVFARWDATQVKKNELFNTYWFVHNMAGLGQRSKDIWATGGASATVYKKGSTYSALVWNPTASATTVTFKNAAGTTGTASVPARSLVRVNPQAQ